MRARARTKETGGIFCTPAETLTRRARERTRRMLVYDRKRSGEGGDGDEGYRYVCVCLSVRKKG